MTTSVQPVEETYGVDMPALQVRLEHPKVKKALVADADEYPSLGHLRMACSSGANFHGRQLALASILNDMNMKHLREKNHAP